MLFSLYLSLKCIWSANSCDDTGVLKSPKALKRPSLCPAANPKATNPWFIIDPNRSTYFSLFISLLSTSMNRTRDNSKCHVIIRSCLIRVFGFM